NVSGKHINDERHIDEALPCADVSKISACLSTYHFTAIKPCAQHGIFCLESFPKLTDMVTI
ncbi:hypothetical protein, partial [Escherichia coli]